jgi:hypothetical protein
MERGIMSARIAINSESERRRDEAAKAYFKVLLYKETSEATHQK